MRQLGPFDNGFYSTVMGFEIELYFSIRIDESD